ncbi:hypothetical protein D3C87_1235690 [compost metagenome]
MALSVSPYGPEALGAGSMAGTSSGMPYPPLTSTRSVSTVLRISALAMSRWRFSWLRLATSGATVARRNTPAPSRMRTRLRGVLKRSHMEKKESVTSSTMARPVA